MRTKNAPAPKGRSGHVKTAERVTTLRSRGALIPLLLASATLAGCNSTSASRETSGLAASNTRPAAGSELYITALDGGLVARNPAASLSGADRQRALEAEYRALEAAPGGQPVAWEGSGVNGAVVAAAPYQVGSQNCRQYSHTLTIDGRESMTRGAACRNANGTWTPLT